ncbi:MAG: protein-ADP-ribose hydrolase [Anaerobutyricum hallii]|uniref:protein-ADP-ribose hydrolase n=1 Tax=Anaerobutyricum hallii TaxID=39488 RepID=UPI00242F0C7D|nr:protein-ADP-ribose hydrolase [Anaerobutyricum hallii]MDD6587982.1 protein-ADP-ribose hydrolase [Anaerobutyricum hallii]
MTQDERRKYLIEYLLKEEIRFRIQPVPIDVQGQRDLLRSLMNVRMPRSISDEFLRVQDEYLQERNIERGITDVDRLIPVGSDKRLYIWQGDITTLKCDAIVNACNSQMLGCFSPMHSCIDNFIHTYAGIQLRLEMNEIMTKQGHEEETGRAKITSGYNLPAKYILHTVGPIISPGTSFASQWSVTKGDEELLASCYRECMKLAADHGVESIAFCCLSTGVFRFPQQRAAEIATATVKEFLDQDDRIKKVIFNVFKDEDLKIYHALLSCQTVSDSQ